MLIAILLDPVLIIMSLLAIYLCSKFRVSIFFTILICLLPPIIHQVIILKMSNLSSKSHDIAGGLFLRVIATSIIIGIYLLRKKYKKSKSNDTIKPLE